VPERSTDGGFARLISHAEREAYEREHLDGNCIFKYSVRTASAVALIFFCTAGELLARVRRAQGAVLPLILCGSCHNSRFVL